MTFNISDEEEEEREKQSAEKILAAKKRKEDDYRSHLAFLHHEDFMHQLGEDVARKESPEREEPQDEPIQIKTEPMDDEQPMIFGRTRNRFAEELENLVPDAYIDLSKDDPEPEIYSDEEDYYDSKRERKSGKGKYRIPHRRKEQTIEEEEREIELRTGY